jgi:hypothetical protein
MKSFLVPIVLAISLISNAATASKPQVIHSDSKPVRCEMTNNGKFAGNCSSFKLLKNEKVYWFTYYFNKSPIMFLGFPMDEDKDKITFGSKQIIYNGKVYDIKDLAVCVMSKKYENILCAHNNIKLYYTRF